MPDYGGGAFVECTNCSCAISGETAEEAAKAWNTRIPMQNIVERLEEKAKEYTNDNMSYRIPYYGIEEAIEIVKEAGGTDV